MYLCQMELLQILKDLIRIGISQVYGALADAIKDLTTGVIGAIIGGWLELIWAGPDDYDFNLLVAGNIGFPDFGGLSESVWKNVIMKYVNELKNVTKKLYTVYFDSSILGNSAPAYGLKQMASSESDAFEASKTDDLMKAFRDIANDVKAYEIDEEKQTTNGVIRLRLYKDIKSIKVGSRELTASELELVKSKIVDNGDGSGNLNLRDSEIAALFKTTEEITVMY